MLKLHPKEILMETIQWSFLENMPGSRRLNPKKYIILEASLKIIHDFGLQGLSVTAISKETGLSKSLILYHYENNDLILLDLFFFLGKLARKIIDENLIGTKSYEDKVFGMIRALFSYVVKNKEVGEFFVLMFHEATKTDSMQKAHQNIQVQAIEIWEKIFFESMRYQDLELLKANCQGVHNLLTGTLLMMIAGKDISNYKNHLTVLKRNVEILLDINLSKREFTI
jgi:AcrR family transcriptional regulator